MEESRPSPDKFLEQLAEEERMQGRGKLKIFFGYAAGVGKTYAMLQAAHVAMEEGIDTVAGYIEPHARPETIALAAGIEPLPVKELLYKSLTLKEFDLDGALRRNPKLILVDELAHTNVVGSRHTKRYQDIQELLKAGINVYTTVNVQHIESLADIVASITGILVQERIPDFVFDDAQQVEVVDIEPQELLNRLKEGKVYRENQANRAMEHFFSVDNLAALREIALRRTADQVNKITKKGRERNPDSDYYTDEHVLVCLSPSPSNAKVIRAAARMAKAFKARFTAVHVEVPGVIQNDENAARFRQNQKLAEQLGAKIVTLYGGDITRQIAEYARLSGVSKIVLGRSYNSRRFFVKPVSFSEQLTQLVPKLEIHLIPDNHEKRYKGDKGSPQKEERSALMWKDMTAILLIMGFATLMAFQFKHLNFHESNFITIYILGVLLTALVTENQVYSFIASLTSVLCFNFFFTQPFWSLKVDSPSYFITFGIMFLSGFITAFLAKKVKTSRRQAVKRAWRTETLLETSQKLQMAQDSTQIATVVSKQLVKLLQRDIIYYPGNPLKCQEPMKFPLENDSMIEKLLTRDEAAVAVWSYRNNKHAGAMTNTLPGAKGLYMAVRSGTAIYGVVGIRMGEEFLSAFDESLLNAMLNEEALALEKERNIQEKNQVKMQMKQEQLRSNFLRGISHDLRTPLTSISGSAGILLGQSENLTQGQKQKLYEGIYDDSVWLYNLVENLLSITRIEKGHMNLNLQPEIVEEVVKEALSHIHRRLEDHEVKLEISDEFLMAWMEPKLIIQVILNLLDNAVKYTKEGSCIVISVKKQGTRAVIEIADDGEGIPNESKEKIFDMFYTGSMALADSKRSMGVGLPLCQSLVAAHGGKLMVRDNIPSGSIFSFDLKAEEVDSNVRKS